MFGLRRMRTTIRDLEETVSGLRVAVNRMTTETTKMRIEQMQNLNAYNEAVAKLAAEVAELRTVQDSAVALINGLRARINALIAANDGLVPTEELQKLSSSLDVGTRALADAVAKNTDDPAPAPAPAVDTPPANPAPEPNPTPAADAQPSGS